MDESADGKLKKEDQQYWDVIWIKAWYMGFISSHDPLGIYCNQQLVKVSHFFFITKYQELPFLEH